MMFSLDSVMASFLLVYYIKISYIIVGGGVEVSDSHIGPIPWDLNRKGSNDQQRHLDKLKDAIKEQLPNVIASTPLINGSDQDVVSVPIKYLDIPKFVPDDDSKDEKRGIGNGDGSASPGDVIVRKRIIEGSGDGDPGFESGENIIEVDVPLEYLISLVFDELKLPKLNRYDRGSMFVDDIEWNTRTRKGPWSQVDLKATVKEALLRKAKGGEDDFLEDDLRFRSWTDVKKPITDAVVFLLRDVSGSMGDEKKYLSRSIAYWLVQWLKQQYAGVRVEFWVHHTEAWEVMQEEAFFQLGEGGGTSVASGVEAIHSRIDVRYPSGINRYLFAFSDGDDYDVSRTITALSAITGSLNLFGYVELRGSYALESPLWRGLNGLHASNPDRIRKAVLSSRKDVGKALKELLGSDV